MLPLPDWLPCQPGLMASRYERHRLPCRTPGGLQLLDNVYADGALVIFTGCMDPEPTVVLLDHNVAEGSRTMLVTDTSRNHYDSP
jgi:hypothetical protein